MASRQLKQLLTSIVETRKQEVIEEFGTGNSQELLNKDVLTMLINANLNQDGSSTYITDSELISNLAIFYAAGHEVSVCNG